MSNTKSATPIAEVLCFGNELLNGRTVNTNATFIGKHLTLAGFHISRITTAEDSRSVAISVIEEIVQRKPYLLIITGGLGPTWDDITLACLAAALNKPLVRNSQAEQLMKDAYARFKLEIKPESYKMTDFPQGANPIFNPIGTAPGIHLKHENLEIFVLPGVPSEMKPMLAEYVLPLISKASASFFFEELFVVEGVPESYLAETITKVRDEFNPVWVKSHPMGTEGNPRIEFQLTLHSVSKEDSELIHNATQRLKSLIKEKFRDVVVINP
ncbi:MAG: competence/damage-inducible protein A [Promethearchaeota archaeon]